MVRDAEPRGGGPLRRGNPMPPENPDIVAHVPLNPEDAAPLARPPRPADAAASADIDDSVPEMTVPRAPRAASTAATPATAAPATRAEAAAAAAAVPTPAAAPATAAAPAPTAAPAAAPVTPTATSSAPAVPTPQTTPTAQTAPTAVRRDAAAPASPVSPATPSVPTAPSWPAPPVAPAQQTPAAPAAPPVPITGVPTSPSVPAAPSLSPAPAVPSTPATPSLSPAQPLAPSPVAPPSRREQREQGIERRSFLQEERREEPARRGGRGFLNKVGFSIGPNARERAMRDDEHEVSRHWPGPRTVAVVNGKGGAGKTPATVLLSAVFAQYGGAGVLAWDNNQTRGTLGWRTEAGAHDRTLLELLPQTQRLLGAQGQSADLAHFVHHQPQEKYDVLRSKPIRLAHENRLSPSDVDSIHAVAAKFYRLIIIDSGNDESDPMWLRMIDLADQIVVATTTRDDHAEAGALLLEALEDRDERSARLARDSVVVVSQADPKASSADVAEVVAGYQPLAREVVSIPFDREMVDGHLRLRGLAAPTQQAWLSAAAAVARGF